jgi:hypothetical protein
MLTLLGYTCAYQRKWSLALEYFDKEIAITPFKKANSNISSRIGKAWVLLHLNQVKESQRIQKELAATPQLKLFRNLSTMDKLAWAALLAKQKKTDEVINMFRKVKNEKSVALVSATIPEIDPYRIMLAEKLHYPEFHPSFITFRRNVKPRWMLFFYHPLFAIIFITIVFGASSVFSDSLPLLLISFLSYLQILTIWLKAQNYRLIISPFQITIMNIRRGIRTIININSIDYIEEYPQGLYKFRIGYFDGKEHTYINIPDDIDEPEKLREILTKHYPIDVAERSIWGYLYIPSLVISIGAFLSPFLWVNILLVIFFLSSIVIGLSRIPSLRRLKLERFKQVGIVFALTIANIIYIAYLLS